MPRAGGGPGRGAYHPHIVSEAKRQVRLGTIYAAHGASHGLVLVFPAVLVALREEFGSSFTTLGVVATLSSMIYGLGALPAGFLADRLGAPLLLRAFAAVSLAACLLAALAPGIWWLAVALVALGAAGALYHPAGLTELTLSAPARGRALGIHGSWGNVGTALAPLVAGVVAAAWTWRAAYALAGLAAALLLLALRWGVPVGRQLPPEARVEVHGRARLVVTLVLSLAVAEGFVFQGFVVFLPAFLAQVGGFDAAAAAKGGALSAAVLALGIPGQAIGGWAAEAAGSTVALRYAAMYGIALLTGLAVRLAGPSLWGLLLAGAFAMAIFVGQPLTNQLLARATRAGQRGTAYGAYFALSFGVGALAGTAGGVLADRSGLPAVFAMLGLVALLNVAGGLALRWLLARDAQAAPAGSGAGALRPGRGGG